MARNQHRLATGMGPTQQNAESDLSAVRGVIWPDTPTLRLKDLLKVLSVSRTKAYELMKHDPCFPKGIPLYDSAISPKFYWTHEAIAWVEGRANKVRARQGGK